MVIPGRNACCGDCPGCRMLTRAALLPPERTGFIRNRAAMPTTTHKRRGDLLVANKNTPLHSGTLPDTVTIYNQSCENMTQTATESVSLVVTSPPYWIDPDDKGMAPALLRNNQHNVPDS